MKKVTFVLLSLLVVGGVMGAGVMTTAALGEGCPTGYVSVVMLEPVQSGGQASKIVGQECRPADANVQEIVLEPMNPADFKVAPDEWANQGEAVNGMVMGPSEETDQRCIVILEPIQPGEQSSKASDPVCSEGKIDTVDGKSLDSYYLISKFYDWTGYAVLLVEYYGAVPCSSTISYGVVDLPDSLDNKFESGSGFSSCDHISVHDFNDYSGPSYSCGANCPSFFALNNEVSSWRVSD
jgi:hypothetical protein